MLILLFGCSKPKDSDVINPKDSISFFIHRAEDIKTPYKLRLAYTEKAIASLIQGNNDSLNCDRK